jgi:acetyl-CoA carboxylase biotin carboxyl carrier protein
VTIDNKDIEAFIRLFERSDWNELRLEVDGLQLVLSNDPKAEPIVREIDEEPAIHSAESPPAAAPTEPPEKQEAAAPEPSDNGLVAIRAPNLGTFYRAPNPGAAPYVEIGQEIGADSEVCLIEVMKLFTPVQAGVSGRIARICVEDGNMVEHDEPLFYVEPGTG